MKQRKKPPRIRPSSPVVNVAPPPAVSRLGFCLLALILVQFLLLIWALAHQFIPSAAWLRLGFYCNLWLSALATGAFYWLFWRKRGAYLSRFKQLFLVLCGPLLLYFLGYFALIYGAADVFTQGFGQPASIQDIWQKNADDAARFEKEYVAAGVYEKRYFDNRKGCITRLTSPLLARGFPVYFCVEGRTFAQLPPQISVRLRGLQSWAGFELQRVDYSQ